MIRPVLFVLALAASSGCADQPTRTPSAAPIEYDEPAAAGDGTPIPTDREPRRIEMH